MDACSTRKTHSKNSCVILRPTFVHIVGKVSEFATNIQRTASTLGAHRAHTRREHCVHVKKSAEWTAHETTVASAWLYRQHTASESQGSRDARSTITAWGLLFAICQWVCQRRRNAKASRARSWNSRPARPGACCHGCYSICILIPSLATAVLWVGTEPCFAGVTGPSRSSEAGK